jgi:hypothetical protein
MQFKAIGTYVHVNHPSFTQDITNQVSWASSNTSVSTISSSGLATAVNVGNTTITATLRSSAGGVSVATAALQTTAGQPAHSLISVTVIPGSGFTGTGQSGSVISQIGEPTQFIAIGNYNIDPLTLDITNQVLWQSSNVAVATIDPNGLAIANNLGTTTISAIGKASNGADIAGTSFLTVTSTGGGGLPMLTVFEVGVGTGTVTSDPAGINCTTQGGCSASYASGTAVTLTAVPAQGSSFGGWSSNCQSNTFTTCTVLMNGNQAVSAIFNPSTAP